MLRKIIFGVLIIVCIAFGIGLYLFFMKPEVISNLVPAQNTTGTGSPWFFPFNRVAPDAQTPTLVSTPTTPTKPNLLVSEPIKRPRLFQLYDKPVSGFYASSTTATSSTVRFVDRGSGHIYETHLQTGATDKISNTTLPKVYTANWSPSGTHTIFGFLRDNDTVPTHSLFTIQKNRVIAPAIVAANATTTGTGVGATATTTNTITPPPATYTVTPALTNRDVTAYITAPQTDRFISLRSTSSGSSLSLGNLATPLVAQQIFQSPLPHWNIEWPTEDFVVLTTKASGKSGGYAYTLNTRTREFDKVISNVLGLTTKMSRDGAKILFSESRGRVVQTKIYSLKDGAVFDTILGTVAHKCVWSRVRTYEVICAVPTTPEGTLMPDDWYKGTVSFDDKFWYLNSQTGETILLIDLYDESKQLIDVMEPTLDPRENYLVFMNKRDLTLWALDLNE